MSPIKMPLTCRKFFWLAMLNTTLIVLFGNRITPLVTVHLFLPRVTPNDKLGFYFSIMNEYGFVFIQNFHLQGIIFIYINLLFVKYLQSTIFFQGIYFTTYWNVRCDLFLMLVLSQTYSPIGNVWPVKDYLYLSFL